MRTIKRGASLFETNTPGEYFLGTRERAIRIYTGEQRIIAEHLARGVSEDEIATVTGVSPIAIHNLMTELAQQSLLDTSQGTFTLSQRFISKVDARAKKNSRPMQDAAYIQLQNRVAPELEQTTWIPGVSDGGVAVLNKRQEFLVEISGGNRVATLLYPLLLASGVTQVRYSVTARGSRPLIGDLDIAVDGISASEFGMPFLKRQEELRRDYTLFPLDKSANYGDEASTPELAVHCGDIDPEKLSSWMCSGQPFIHIPHPRAGRADIGPIVIPGKTPCLRCAQLSEQDQSGVITSRKLNDNGLDEYPIVAAHSVAALAAAAILAFCDGHGTFGTITAVDYQSLAQPQVVAITRHPLCGCAFSS